MAKIEPESMNDRKTPEHRHEIWQVLDAISKVHNEQGIRITELRARVSSLALPTGERPRCQVCGSTFRTTAQLEEHGYHVHGGALPTSYAAAELAAGLTPL